MTGSFFIVLFYLPGRSVLFLFLFLFYPLAFSRISTIHLHQSVILVANVIHLDGFTVMIISWISFFPSTDQRSSQYGSYCGTHVNLAGSFH